MFSELSLLAMIVGALFGGAILTYLICLFIFPPYNGDF